MEKVVSIKGRKDVIEVEEANGKKKKYKVIDKYMYSEQDPYEKGAFG